MNQGQSVGVRPPQTEQVVDAADRPHDLEVMYRADPNGFAQALPDALAERPDSPVLQAWRERLFFDTQTGNERSSAVRSRARDIVLTIVLSLVAGTLAKLPHFLPALDEKVFYSRNLAAILLGALMVFFCVRKRCRIRTVVVLFSCLLAGVLYLNLLPDRSSSQTVVLTYMHMPFFLWSLLGIAFLGGAWRNLPGRMDYVRYCGELLVYTTIVLLGGMVLTGLTFALFRLIGMSIGEWYQKNVVVYGATAAPIVATLLIERVIGDRLKIAPLLAKVFAPLFLLTVAAYLVAMVLSRKSPFTDRDFLITFNGLLLVVLALCVFSVAGRGPQAATGVVDVVNTGLASLTLVIDVIALAAILFRLTSYGFTPNRLAVLGANLLAFVHLAGILWRYTRFIGRSGALEGLEKWIVGYVPAYTAWSMVVAVGFPLLFRFR